MSNPPRRIKHPGPVALRRLDAVDASLARQELRLPPGRTLLAALTEALPVGSSAVLTLQGGSFFPFAYVMPALSKTPDHAVYFSDRFDAVGPVQLEMATVTFGLRDGRPSLHCHARWVDAEGVRHCGHVLPDYAVIAAPVQASAWLIDGAGFEVTADEETRFSLFKPVPRPASRAAGPAVALRLAPNEDVCSALEAICRERGIASATVRGGVGSIVGAVFDDGRTVEPFVTELLVSRGRVRSDERGEPVAEIEVSLVDYLGGLADGRLQRGANPVLVTFELVLELHMKPD
nr:DUF296 domain-containing protein [uncultured Roseateles sp.]